ncbi:hypothetical protein [Actomonas aquatica]|uniref:Uncharacterized protein n=1 Tax=Actomonas aquatica TaxID=2866162 RepID=A0ABZ1CDZ5_9BACT|nr:hypothetical protein [Opitutus sp. WL0086]WRQ89908.1 hypothetical protein K1X11_010865 [Opitutus sp. WL0086]
MQSPRHDDHAGNNPYRPYTQENQNWENQRQQQERQRQRDQDAQWNRMMQEQAAQQQARQRESTRSRSSSPSKSSAPSSSSSGKKSDFSFLVAIITGLIAFGYLTKEQNMEEGPAALVAVVAGLFLGATWLALIKVAVVIVIIVIAIHVIGNQ